MRLFGSHWRLLLPLLTLWVLLTQAGIADDAGLAALPFAALIGHIPAEPRQAPSGSQFAQRASALDSRQRELAIRDEILAGNIPGFLRKLVPVEITYQLPQSKLLTATIFVMPEYLAIGSDQDFLRIPMNLYTASAVASKLGFVLPTRKMVNAIYAHSAYHFSPEPMTAGPQMRSTEYYRIHNQKIEQQARSLGIPSGVLVSGDKKDVVLTNLLASNPGRIAIFGWHRLDGKPIQPLSTVHGACYADYSHGIRLVSESMLVDGERRSVYDVLQDPVLSKLISDEGPIPGLRSELSHLADSSCAPEGAKPQQF